MEFKKQQQHVVLFPFMAQGHITPFLLLAELIHKTYPHYTVTLVNTPLNIQNVHSSLPPNSKINLRSLPFDPTAHGLPPGAESTATAPLRLIPSLLRASETLQPAFEQLIINITKQDSETPICIISDYFCAWTVDVARQLGAFHSIFFTGGAYGTAIFASLWKHLPQTKTASEEFLLPEFPHIRLHRSQLDKCLTLAAANGSDGFSVFIQRQLELCSRSDCALVNTVEEFERLGLSMLKMQLNLQLVFPIGPLSMLSASINPIEMNLLRWLDSNPPASVLYVSFGSQNSIDALQMMQLAMALELTSIPFIWVIRLPVGFDRKGEFRPECLPEGFEERTRTTKRGFMVHEWAPQVEILSHPSTGAFLSHCGWNSVLESLVRGVPIVGWPLAAEQFYNSKFLEEEVGVCVEVARGCGESSRVNKEEIGRGIEVVMSNEEMRRKAKEIGQVLRGAMKEKEDDDGEIGSSLRMLKEFFKVAFSK